MNISALEILEKDYKDRWGQNASVPTSYFNSIVDENKKAKVLEIGCSEGYNLNFLFNNGFYSLCGIDRDEVAIEKAKNKYKHISFEPIDITDFSDLISIFDSKFDVIFCKSCLQHVVEDKIQSVLKTISNALNDDGKLFLYETGFEDNSWRNRGLSEHNGIELGSGVFSHQYSNLLKNDFQDFKKIEQNFYICKK